MTTQQDLHHRIAQLESELDLRESELAHLNELLTRCGFVDGIQTLKATVEELLSDTENFQLPPGQTPPPELF